jgi:replication factor C subunit 2/4
MQLHDDTIQHISLSDLDKALICEKIAQADQCLVDGASEKLQLLDVASYIMRRINKM